MNPNWTDQGTLCDSKTRVSNLGGTSRGTLGSANFPRGQSRAETSAADLRTGLTASAEELYLEMLAAQHATGRLTRHCAGPILQITKYGPKSVPAMSQSILSLSEFKADASRLLDRLRDEPATLVLTQNGRARAVVEDYDQYQARERALLLLKLMAQGERDVADGRLSEQEQVFTDLRRRLISGEPADG